MSRDVGNELNNICRCCLRPGVLQSIFAGNKTKTSSYYNEMITFCCELLVTKNDGLPEKICTKCVSKLKSSYKFKRKCIESDTKLLILKKNTPKHKKSISQINIEESNDTYEVSRSEDEIHYAENTYFVHGNTVNCKRKLDQLKDTKTEIKPLNGCSEDNEIFEKEMTSMRIKVEELHDEDSTIDSPEKKYAVSEVIKEKKDGYKTKSKSKDSRGSNIKKRPKFECEICGQYFFKSINLQKHINWIHYGIKPYHCSICNKDYMSEKQHRDVHENSFSATCDQCGKTYTARQSYKNHMESHGNKEYLCECGLTFKVKAFFNNHIKLVHAPKKFMCHFCSKAFTMKGVLISHLRVHTGEKPFECQLCQQRFRKKAMLKRHAQGKHSDVRTFQCQQCLKEFKTRNVLGKHMIVHRVRRFACRVCQKPFGRVDNRNVHERSVHSVSKEEAKLMWPS